ncbi:MAG: CDP-alcohol phosphatidyltransferase family protein [Tannerella sp.]|nr:CDP-alcohol phosphatidyltransferase family protein [Tannerella sp.]
MTQNQKKADVESTFKSLDTEEFIDIHFYRPIGYRWALFFKNLGVSPNTVTIFSIFIGIAAGICFYYTSLAVNLTGMFLLIWANTYDSADGQLARMTGQKTMLGRILDGMSGDLWFIAIYAAVCFRMMPAWSFWIWVLAAIAGFSHTKQASIADYYRNAHLLFLKGESGGELSNSAPLREQYQKLSWKHNFFAKFLAYFYLNYTVGQEQWTPNFQRMIAVICDRYHDEAPEWFRTAFRKKSLPLMKYTNMLSFNTRVIVLFIALGVNIPWIYFAFELSVLNIMLLYTIITHERFCKAFTAQLASQSND